MSQVLCNQRDSSSVGIPMAKTGPSDFLMTLGNDLYLDF